MPSKRSYGDVCGVARALDLVGERWTLMVVRELLLGPKRFTDLRAGLPHIGPDVLTQRLKDMEAGGLLRRRTLPPPAPAKVYELTDLGRRLEGVIMALGDFGAVLPVPEDCAMQMSFDAHILSLRTLFRPDLATDMRIQLWLDDQPFAATVEHGRFTIDRGELDDADATIEGAADELIAVAHGRMKLSDSSLRLSGDEKLAVRFTTLFPLPDPVLA